MKFHKNDSFALVMHQELKAEEIEKDFVVYKSLFITFLLNLGFVYNIFSFNFVMKYQFETKAEMFKLI